MFGVIYLSIHLRKWRYNPVYSEFNSILNEVTVHKAKNRDFNDQLKILKQPDFVINLHQCVSISLHLLSS